MTRTLVLVPPPAEPASPLPPTAARTPARRGGVPHRLPVPAWEPPMDDEQPTALGTGAALAPLRLQDGLALGYALVAGVGSAPAPAPAPTPAPAPSTVTPPPARAPRPTTSAPRHLRLVPPLPPEPVRVPAAPARDERVVAGVVRALLEVLDGHRTVEQLDRLVTRRVRAELVGAVVRPGARRAASADGRRERPRVRSVRTSRPTDDVVEACATVVRRGRVRAVALRLEVRDGRWLCSELCLG